MEYRFYIAEGPKSEELIALCVCAEQFTDVFRDTLREETGAENLFCRASKPGKPVGFVFSKMAARAGLKFGAAIEEGCTYFPDLETDAGKKLAEALNDKRLEFDMSSFLLRELGLELEVVGFCESCRNIRAVFKSHAFFLDNGKVIFVKVPVDEMLFPVPPDFLREVKESEWLAMQGK